MQKSTPPLQNNTSPHELKSLKGEEFLVQKSKCVQALWGCTEHHQALLTFAPPALAQASAGLSSEAWQRLLRGPGRNVTQKHSPQEIHPQAAWFHNKTVRAADLPPPNLMASRFILPQVSFPPQGSTCLSFQ